ncbi:hypothetical protein [Listeria newyorkensis]|nr:hypothetical protein [Listeria newyorkensis]
MMECKYCKSNKGYFEKVKLEEPIRHYYHFDGEDMTEDEAEYVEPDNIVLKPASKFIYCAECERKIGEIKDAPHRGEEREHETSCE